VKRSIEIFDNGKIVGLVEINTEFGDDSLMELINGTINDKPVTVLHVRDMDYGMVIPEHIAEKLNEQINIEENRKEKSNEI
jgi:hypothetical protein